MLTPVDCSDLPRAPDEVVAAFERSEAGITDGDLDPGEGQVAFQLSDDQGARWYLSPETDEAMVWIRDDGSMGPRWNLRVKLLDCSPEAAAFVTFAREDGRGSPLVPGVYPVLSVAFDVPQREQSMESRQVDDTLVTLTEATDDRVSGYMEGGGSGTIRSNLTQEEIGPDCTIGAAAFRNVPVYPQSQ